jgi:hypothetical protein
MQILTHPWDAGIAPFGQGIAYGAGVEVNTTKAAAWETASLVTDAVGSAAKWIGNKYSDWAGSDVQYTYDARSQWLQGYQNAADQDAYLAKSAWSAVRSAVTLGTWDIGVAIGDFIKTGDATHATQMLTGVAFGNLLAAGAGEVTGLSGVTVDQVVQGNARAFVNFLADDSGAADLSALANALRPNKMPLEVPANFEAEVAGPSATLQIDVSGPSPSPTPVRPATQQPMGGNGVVLSDGAGATPAEIAASTGGPTGGTRAGQGAVRDQLIEDWQLENPGEPFQCWRCGATSTNPADFHVGHRNVSTSAGGNLEAPNVVLEGAACNLSAGNRGAPRTGMSCTDRGGPGAPYGR